MAEKTKGIVIEVRKHNDKNNIVTLFTPEYGRVAFLSSVSSTRGGKMRAARLQLLSVVETEFTFKPAKELHRLGNVQLLEVWDDLYFHPMKRLITIFIAEFLSRLLRASMPDEMLWNYIYGSLVIFNESSDIFNDFPIAFLCGLLPLAGIRPDTSTYSDGFYFDMREGKFTIDPPLHKDFLKEEEARFAAMTSRINYTNIKRLKLKSVDRRRILNGLLQYYSLHYPGIANMKSTEAIRELFT